MLYESTKSLLASILRSLEANESRWDDQTESGNACLYEMHQMAGPLYKAYRSDRLNANSLAQSSFPEKLNRAMPHVRLMVIAIRHKDRTGAIDNGRAALVEMNRPNPSMPIGERVDPTKGSGQPIFRRQGTPPGRRQLVVQDARSSKRIRAAGRKRDQ